MSDLTDAQILGGVSAAIAMRDMAATASLIRLLAVQAPDKAQVLYDAIVHRKVTVDIPLDALATGDAP